MAGTSVLDGKTEALCHSRYGTIKCTHALSVDQRVTFCNSAPASDVSILIKLL